MSKEQLEKYRTLGGWLLFLAIFSFGSLIRFILVLVDAFPSINDLTESDYLSLGIWFSISFLVLIVLIYQCLGFIKRNRNWVAISIVCALILNLLAFSEGLDLLLNFSLTLVWVFYLHIAKRANIFLCLNRIIKSCCKILSKK